MISASRIVKALIAVLAICVIGIFVNNSHMFSLSPSYVESNNELDNERRQGKNGQTNRSMICMFISRGSFCTATFLAVCNFIISLKEPVLLKRDSIRQN